MSRPSSTVIRGDLVTEPRLDDHTEAIVRATLATILRARAGRDPTGPEIEAELAHWRRLYREQVASRGGARARLTG